MRVRVATTALGITAALLTLPACSPDTHEAKHHSTSSARTGQPDDAAQTAAPLTSTTLERRLLDQSDLGSGYLRKPERPARHDDVTVLGCPALSKLGSDAATGGTLAFPGKAKTTFTYAGSSSEISEELYSDSANKLSEGISRIFDAMTGCPTYQVVTGGTPIDITSQKLSAFHELGDEQWSQLLTFSTGARSAVVQADRDPRRQPAADRLRFPDSRRPPPRQGPRQSHSHQVTVTRRTAAPGQAGRRQQCCTARPAAHRAAGPQREANHSAIPLPIVVARTVTTAATSQGEMRWTTTCTPPRRSSRTSC